MAPDSISLQCPDSGAVPGGNISDSDKLPRIFRRGLGFFWILAGILQFQPLMFTSDFYAWYPPAIMESTIQTAADDQPHLVTALVHFGSNVWGTEPILFNVCAATLQLAIGLLLVVGKSFGLRAGLILSIIWGVLVWMMAEAFGGVFGGSSYFDGFPGAAFLFVVSALVLLASNNRQNPANWIGTVLRYIVSIYWFVVALVQVLPSSGFWDANGLMEPFANEAAQPGPALLALPVQWFASIVPSNTGTINLIIILLMVLMAVLSLFQLWNRFTITLAVLWLLWSWWFGQGFGGIFTGAGTDVNSIPLIALWMVCLWLRPNGPKVGGGEFE